MDRVYPVVFIDAMVVKIRGGQVTNRPVYAPISVTVDGERDALGLWVGNGGEDATFWLQVFTEINNRGTEDVRIVVCDGLKGPADAVDNTWPLAIVQTCVPHLIHNTFRFEPNVDWDKMARHLRPVHTAVSEHDAEERFAKYAEVWGGKCPAIVRPRENSGVEFAPLVDYSSEIRKIIYSTNAVESLHARTRRATRASGRFPTEQVALKYLYLVAGSLDATGRGPKRWINRWKAALNTSTITFEGRILPTNRERCRRPLPRVSDRSLEITTDIGGLGFGVSGRIMIASGCSGAHDGSGVRV